MIRDYSEYHLTGTDLAAFYGIGYTCVFTGCYLFYHSIVLALASGVLVGIFKPRVEAKLAERRIAELNTQFKDLLYSLSASVAAGRQMNEALIEAEDNLSVMYKDSDMIMRELKHIRISILENKESDKSLLSDFARRSHAEDINNFVQVYVTSRNTGGNLEKIIEHTCQIITDKMTIEKEIRVITNQKKTEGRIISLMPFAMLLAMNVTSSTYIQPLYASIAGRLVMTGALIGMVAGLVLMERISAIEI